MTDCAAFENVSVVVDRFTGIIDHGDGARSECVTKADGLLLALRFG